MSDHARLDIGSHTALNVTAILCTCNRAKNLAGTLESLAASQLPDSVSWEVLVVDNNSTDQTREVVEDFCRRHPGRFRYLFEEKPGKSYALNSGIANARGEILAFVDDDVTVETRWLGNLTTGLLSGEWAGTAGRILPAQTFTPPPWLSWEDCGGAFRPDPLGILCAHFDWGDQPRDLDLEHLPYGANMAFRRSAFEKCGGFRLDLGPRPKSQIRGEDVEFARRVIRAGERLRYEPSAVVYHPVPQGRISKEFFLSWWFDYGRASIIERGDRPDALGVPWDYLSLLRHVIAISIITLRGILATRPHKRFFCKCMVRKETGMVVELYRRLAGRKVSQSTALS
jgi:glycosyltransferase involved in cell wall biosynthesis